MLTSTVFTEIEFWLLVVFSFALPFGIYWLLLSKRTIARVTVLCLGLSLVVIAGVDVYLLQILKSMAIASQSLVDDVVFGSEVSTALFVFPAMFGGIGINLLSHVLIDHLHKAENRFTDEHSDS